MKRIILLCCICVGLILPNQNAMAGAYIARDAEVIAVNNLWNGHDFTVTVQGGTGLCMSPARIRFSEASAYGGDIEVFRRAYAMALLALATGAKVHIYNFSNDTCDGASYIELIK